MSRAKPPAASAVTPGGKKEGAPGPKATRSGKRANAGVGSALDFSHDLGRIVVGQVLYQTGFDKLQFRTADLLAEIMFRYLELLATSTKGNAENAGRTEANLEDVNDVFYDLGVKMDDLREFCKLWLVEKSTKERGADKDGEPPDKSVPAGNDADDGERDGLGPKDAEGAGGSAAGAEQGEADASGAQSSRFVVAAPATVTGQFLRLPPGPFPVDPTLLQGVESSTADGESETSRKRKRLPPNAEDWMPPLPGGDDGRDAVEEAVSATIDEGSVPRKEDADPGMNPDGKLEAVDLPANDRIDAAVEMDIDARDNDGPLDGDPLFRLIPFEKSKLHEKGRTFAEPLLPFAPVVPPSAKPRLGTELDEAAKNQLALDELLRVAMEATSITDPGPIGYTFEAIRNPERFWDPTKGPPRGLGPDVLGKEQIRLHPYLARPLRQMFLRPMQDHLSGAASSGSLISEMVELDGPDLQPLFWQVPFRSYANARPFVPPAPQKGKQAARQGSGAGGRGGFAHPVSRGGGFAGGSQNKKLSLKTGGHTPARRMSPPPQSGYPLASPPYAPRASSPLAQPMVMSPTVMTPGGPSIKQELFSPVMDRVFFPGSMSLAHEPAPGTTNCICDPPHRYTDQGFQVECEVCKYWFHGSCVGVREAEVTEDTRWICPRCKRK